jgi:hypothetical protein
VTETQWLNATDASSLLHVARELSSERKDRLFAAALARHLFPIITHPDLSRGLELVEQLADGTAGGADLEPAREFFDSMTWVCDYEARGIVGVDMVLACFIRESLQPRVRRSRVLAYLSDYVADRPENPWCGLPALRDIFSNPFRAGPFSPAWRTDTTVALARQMYEWRDFGAMPILADALQDAGCDCDDMLDHCRGKEPHVRGCWAVDLLLGKG